MSLVEKKYKKLVKELVYVYAELEFVNDVLKDAHYEFESYYQQYCRDKDVPIDDLNKKHEEVIKREIPQPKKMEVDEDGIIKTEQPPKKPESKVHKVFTRMYRMIAKKIHPDKFSGRELTPEVIEKISMFKEATKSYNQRDWGKFLDICDKLDITPTRYDGISSVLRDEISNLNKKIVKNKRTFSWKLYECEDDDGCKELIIKDFLFQLFKYKL